MSIRLTNAEKLALVTVALGLIHHLDHVLRVDHSGWPFLNEVNAFTYSLLVYPVIAVVLLARGWPSLRAALAFLLFLFPTLSHIFIETPATQHHTWANRPGVNLLGVSSQALGIAAGIVTVLLSVAALLTFLAFLQEARKPSSTERIFATRHPSSRDHGD